MDREILFRGKRIDNGEWIYGSLINNESVPRIIVNSEYSTGTTYVSYAPRIDSKTIGQFTGKYDNNGNRIFEGDIVTQPVRETRKHSNCIIEFINGKFQAHYKSSNKYFDRYYDINSYTKVIGNIYDNKEILGETK